MLLDDAFSGVVCEAAEGPELFMVVFVAVGEGGVACGVASRGNCDGGMIDAEDGATMGNLYQFVVVVQTSISMQFWRTFQRVHWGHTLIRFAFPVDSNQALCSVMCRRYTRLNMMSGCNNIVR